MRTSTIRRIAIGLVIVLAGYVAYDRFASPYEVMADGRAAIVSSETVSVRQDPYLVFEPINGTPKAGLVFYVGARVPPAAYAPLARDLAADGYLVAIPNMPFNFAVFGQSAANDVFDDYPDITKWAVGGHSLGGAMAASYAHRSSRVAGLLLLAAHPGDSLDLSLRDGLTVTVVYASQDERATVEEVEGARDQLPDRTEWVLIQGGNHAQFGWYGSQSGDGAAMIPRIEQQQQTSQAALELMRAID